MKIINKVEDIPKEPHWATMDTKSIHIPGDERSRTHPGHGYPATTEYAITYMAFESEEEMNEWLTGIIKSTKKRPHVFFVEKKTYDVSISVN